MPQPGDAVQHLVFLADLEGTYTPGQAFDGFSAGTFTDMWGREIVVTVDELDLYVLHTLRAIEATRDSSGQPVGLPIDAKDHEGGDGAGFIVDVARAPGSTLLQFTPRWTDVGMDILSRGIRRWCSATFNTYKKVIVGATLTNWPATRDEMERVMLRPIELSSGLYRFDRKEDPPMTNIKLSDLTDEQRRELAAGIRQELAAELTPAIRESVLAELAGPKQGETPEQMLERLRKDLNITAFGDVADLTAAREAMLAGMQTALRAEYERMQAQAGQQLASLMGQIKRQSHIADFALKMTSGGQDQPFALPVQAAELEKALTAMDDGTRQRVEAMLTSIVTAGLTEYQEQGHGRSLKALQAVPEYAVDSLKLALAAGATPETFFETAGLGLAEDFDLSGFVGQN